MNIFSSFLQFKCFKRITITYTGENIIAFIIKIATRALEKQGGTLKKKFAEKKLKTLRVSFKFTRIQTPRI